MNFTLHYKPVNEKFAKRFLNSRDNNESYIGCEFWNNLNWTHFTDEKLAKTQASVFLYWGVSESVEELVLYFATFL